MSASASTEQTLVEQVRAAHAARRPLHIRGGGSKTFIAPLAGATTLDTRAHAGIVDYAPSELVITARAGTPLADIEALLAEQGQMLAFEPPHFGAATLGGCVASGLSGPARAYAGAARDFVLGVRVLDGQGQVLRFGGQVMKNVAGFDVSRLMTGAWGTLGVVLEASVKTMPRPAAVATRVLALSAATAVDTLNRLAGRPLPLNASFWHAGMLYLRWAGARTAVAAACQEVGGEAVDERDAACLWQDVREHRHAFAQGGAPLWRLSVHACARLPKDEDSAIEWGGALRWWAGELPADEVRAWAQAGGGHAQVFRGATAAAFHPLPAPMQAIQRRIKRVFDPLGLFNPGLFDL
ncbi:MAG: glycolate oxidase subunit GlcE [Rhodocyclaceae bacterium]